MEWWIILFVFLPPVLFFAIVFLVDKVCEIKEERKEQFKHEFEMLKASARELINKQKEEGKERMGYVKSQWQGECAVNDWIKEHESDLIPYSCSITANTATLRVANDGVVWQAEPLRPNKRLYCEYCGCISEKEHGTCGIAVRR